MDERRRRVDITLRLQQLLALQSGCIVAIELIYSLVRQDGLRFLLALLVEDSHVEAALKSFTTEVSSLDEALKGVMGLAGLRVEDPDAHPVYIAVRIFVDGVLEGILALSEVLLF